MSPRRLLRIALLIPVAIVAGICLARLSRLARGDEDVGPRAVALNVLAAWIGTWCLGLYDRLGDEVEAAEERRPLPPPGACAP